MATAPGSASRYSQAYLSQNVGPVLSAFVGIWLVLSVVCVLGRLWARRIKRVGLGIDDWLVIVAEAFAMALAIDTLLLPRYGIGRHLAYIETVEPQDLRTIGKLSFVLEITYVPCMGFAKMSLAALYLRIFFQPPRWFRISCWIAVAYTIAWVIGQYIGIFVSCWPVSRYWDSNCIAPSSTPVATGVLNVASDVFLFAIPLPLVWSLHIPLARRISVCCLFLIGLFATAISIARIPLIVDTAYQDFTYTFVAVDLLTVLEPLSLIICGCLPAMQVYWQLANDAIKSNSASSHSRHGLNGDQQGGLPHGTSAGNSWVSLNILNRSRKGKSIRNGSSDVDSFKNGGILEEHRAPTGDS